MNVTGCTLSLTVSIDFDVLAELLNLTVEEVVELWNYGNLQEVLQSDVDILDVLECCNDLYEYQGLKDFGSGY